MSAGKSHNKVGFALIGLVILLVLFLLISAYRKEEAAAISQQAYEPTDSSLRDSLGADRVNRDRLKNYIQATKNAPIDTTALDSQINTIISSNSDIILSVGLKDLKTGSIHNYGHTGSMTAASVTKVLTAVDYLKEVELGHKSLDAVLYDGNTAQYDMEQMIVVSDNNAWHTLNDSLTYTQMQSYAYSIGLSTYYYVDNTISTADITKLLGELYQRHLINETNTQLLLSYMERANFRDLIIPAVPTYDTVYHKSGWLESYLNDATIITNSEHAIVLTIFTDSITNYDKARISSIMQQITTPTLETFSLN